MPQITNRHSLSCITYQKNAIFATFFSISILSNANGYEFNLSSLNGSNGFIIQSNDINNSIGYSVSGVGDINGDGLSDFAIGGGSKGSRIYHFNKMNNKCHVVFGTTYDIPQIWNLNLIENDSSLGFVVYEVESQNNFQVSVSGAGDVNQDGFDDFLVGAFFGDGPNQSRQDCGVTHLIFGQEKPFKTPFIISNLLEEIDEGVVFYGANAGDLSGRCVAGAGDVNGDGFADFLIGANRATGINDNLKSAGKTYLIFGRNTSDFPPSIDLKQINDGNKEYGLVFSGFDGFDFSGKSVSGVGDFNGDGFDDFIIGAYKSYGNGNLIRLSGEAYVVFGKSDIANSSFDLNSLEFADGTNGFVIFGEDRYDGAGVSVHAAGDVNGDGFSDLIIGAHEGQNNRNIVSGKAYIFLGTDKKFGPIVELSSLNDGSDMRGFVLNGVDRKDYCGRSVCGVGDMNGDGFADILIGAFRTYGYNNFLSNTGEIYVVFGKGSNSDHSFDLSTLRNPNELGGFITFGSRKFVKPTGLPITISFLGISVSSLGDFNGDTFPDLLIGANLTNNAVAIFGTTVLEASSYKSHARGGDAPNKGIGILGNGRNDATPDSRTWIDFQNGGDAPSLQTVVVHRSDQLIKNFPQEQTADVYWEITTDRKEYSGATVTFKYSNTEIARIYETTMQLYQSPTPEGPWEKLINSSVDEKRNKISGEVSLVNGYFAFGGQKKIITSLNDLWMFQGF